MDMTLFLAQLWGPVLLAVGAGLFLSRKYYRRVYRGIENEPLATLAFGTFAVVIGIMQIMAHNLWETTPEIIVSLLGWGTLLKGAVIIIMPESAGEAARKWQSVKLMPLSAGLVLVLGLYLSWFAYMA